MKDRMRPRIDRMGFLILLIYLLAFPLLGMDVAPIDAKASKTPKGTSGNAYDVIAAVNQLRTSNGLSPFQVNGALMAAAQAHSEYQASIGSITHAGRGGSNATGRAIAAGYGGGAAVSVTENIYGGTNATPQQAVSWWRGDSLHLNTMLSSKAVDAGAGVATDGSVVYYTLDVGYIVGSGGHGNSTSNPTTPIAGNPTTPGTVIAFYPVQISTPKPDGSVIHVVQAGQTLWTIAATYKVGLADLLTINGFTNNTFIYPGQKIIIKSPEAQPNATVTHTGSPASPTATRESTNTPSSTVAIEVIQQEVGEGGNSTGKPFPSSFSEPLTEKYAQWRRIDPILLVVAVLIFGGGALIVVGNALQRGNRA